MGAVNVLHTSRNTAIQLDHVNQCAKLEGNSISLSPKAFSVLAYLAERAGRLVTKQELLDALWPDVHVTEGVLKRAVLEIRKALADPVEEPRFIQTLHRRGYRFLASSVPAAATEAAPEQRGFIGRRKELAVLDRRLEESLAGFRQVVFVTGEAGLGKTTLVQHFERRIASRVSVVRGRCLPRFGSADPFLPVFEVLEHLNRKAGPRLVEILRAHAPNWLLQMPSLVPPKERAAIQSVALSVSPERMVREMAAALEALSLEIPLVVVFEDMQWSDPATINLLSAIAARSSEARLMIVATYRPEEAVPSSSLRIARNDMELHEQCQALPLRAFSELDTAEYFAARFPEMTYSPSFAPTLHQRSSGNPRHIACMCDELAQSGDLESIATRVPHTLQQMFERQATQCSGTEQELLDAAAVAGSTFSVAAVASVLGWSEEQVETTCEAMVSRQFILTRAESVSCDLPGYGFVHPLCRDALYQRIPAGRRARLQPRFSHAERANSHSISIPRLVASVLFPQQSPAFA